MRVWWYLHCDDGHQWEGDTEDASLDAPAHLVLCPICGLEAVTASRRPPADRVRVSLVPSTCISDPVTGQVAREDRYYIEVSSQDGSEAMLSTDDYQWKTAVEQASWFRNLTWIEAENRWQRTGLGSRS
jgi:hypothetical protein